MFYVRFIHSFIFFLSRSLALPISLPLCATLNCECNESFPHINYVGGHFTVALQLATVKCEKIVEMSERRRHWRQKAVFSELFSGNKCVAMARREHIPLAALERNNKRVAFFGVQMNDKNDI